MTGKNKLCEVKKEKKNGEKLYIKLLEKLKAFANIHEDFKSYNLPLKSQLTPLLLSV